MYEINGSPSDKYALKSDNLQYDELVRWVAGTNDSSDVPSIIFFIISYRLRALKTLYFHFCNFIKKLIERVSANNFARFYEKKKYLEHQTLG